MSDTLSLIDSILKKNVKSETKHNPNPLTYSNQLLDIALHLIVGYGQDIKKDNYDTLKIILYHWCLLDTAFDTTKLTVSTTDQDLKLTYTDWKYITELEYQIDRFLQFGCMYWRGGNFILANARPKPNVTLSKLIHTYKRKYNDNHTI